MLLRADSRACVRASWVISTFKEAPIREMGTVVSDNRSDNSRFGLGIGAGGHPSGRFEVPIVSACSDIRATSLTLRDNHLLRHVQTPVNRVQHWLHAMQVVPKLGSVGFVDRGTPRC